MVRSFRWPALIALVTLGIASPALAHPHVLVDAKDELVFNQGKLAAISHVWKFDEAFSAFATQGLDANNDGKLSADELAPLAQVNVDSLSGFAYFSYLTVDGNDVDFKPPTQYHLEYDGSQLTLFYTLPLKTPVTINDRASLEVFDPEYFVAFTFVQDKPVTLTGAPAACTETLTPPTFNKQTLAVLATIPPDQQVLPPELRQAASVLANLIVVSCKPTGAAVRPVASPTSAPADAASGGGFSSADIAKIAAAEAARVAAGVFAQ